MFLKIKKKNRQGVCLFIQTGSKHQRPKCIKLTIYTFNRFIVQCLNNRKCPKKVNNTFTASLKKHQSCIGGTRKRFDLLIFLLSSRLIHGVRSFSSMSSDYPAPGRYRHLLNVEHQSFWRDNAANPSGLPAVTLFFFPS